MYAYFLFVMTQCFTSMRSNVHDAWSVMINACRNANDRICMGLGFLSLERSRKIEYFGYRLRLNFSLLNIIGLWITNEQRVLEIMSMRIGLWFMEMPTDIGLWMVKGYDFSRLRI